MVLSLDISITSTGYCVFEGSNLKAFGCIRTTSELDIYSRLKYIESEISSIIRRYGICEVAVEAPSYGSRGAMSYNLFGVHFSIIRLLTAKQLPYKLLNIASIKKFATDSGKASKLQMLNALPEDIRTEFINSGYLKSKGLYDLADAYFIGMKYIKER